MNRTSIEWVKNPDGTQGYTWNPITGCLNSCEYCYARKLANGRLKMRYLDNKNYPIYATGRMQIKLFTEPETDPFYPRFWTERLVDPYAIKKSCGIFTVDMGELFGDWIPEDWQDKIFSVIKSCPQHRFYLLTKQPQNLIKFSPFPDNCWVGVTVTNREQYLKATGAYGLVGIKAKVKYISFEPLLQYIPTNPPYDFDGINWVIIGSQTQPEKQPPAGAVNAILNAADIAKTPVFMKDNLAWQYHRQEVPNV